MQKAKAPREKRISRSVDAHVFLRKLVALYGARSSTG